MQTSYGFSELQCFSKTNTNSHSHSAPALYLTTRAEARIGGNSCRQSFRANSRVAFFFEETFESLSKRSRSAAVHTQVDEEKKFACWPHEHLRKCKCQH